MKTLQGFRTLIFNTIAILTAWLAERGIDLPEEHQSAILVTIIAIINIILRLVTKTPVGKKEEEVIKTKVIKDKLT